MIIKRLWLNNPLRNFNYLIVCPDTNIAAALDPLDHQRCADIAKENGWNITQIINTHEHHDHIGGNSQLKQLTGAKILAHHAASIPDVDINLQQGDKVNIGNIELMVLDTPGHTMTHICLYKEADRNTRQPILFSGDTLFSAGIGNCRNGGHPEELFETIQHLQTLPENTLIYSGHDYLINNLGFTIDREPDNEYAKAMLDRYQDQEPENAYVTCLAEEKEMNVFLRLNSESVLQKLSDDECLSYTKLSQKPKMVFLKLRELRNHW